MNKLLTRFKASEHGGEYLMRFISAWLCSLILILPFRPISKIFDKEYAGEAPYLLLILFSQYSTACLPYCVLSQSSEI